MWGLIRAKWQNHLPWSAAHPAFERKKSFFGDALELFTDTLTLSSPNYSFHFPSQWSIALLPAIRFPNKCFLPSLKMHLSSCCSFFLPPHPVCSYPWRSSWQIKVNWRSTTWGGEWHFWWPASVSLHLCLQLSCNQQICDLRFVPKSQLKVLKLVLMFQMKLDASFLTVTALCHIFLTRLIFCFLFFFAHKFLGFYTDEGLGANFMPVLQ